MSATETAGEPAHSLHTIPVGAETSRQLKAQFQRIVYFGHSCLAKSSCYRMNSLVERNNVDLVEPTTSQQDFLKVI